MSLFGIDLPSPSQVFNDPSSLFHGGAVGELAGSLAGNPLGGLRGHWSPFQVAHRISGGASPGDDHSASDTLGQLTREQFADYLKRYVPEENMLINYATSPKTITEAGEQAGSIAGAAFDQQPGMLRRRLSAYGVTPSADQMADISRQSGTQRALSVVDAENRSRDFAYEQQMTALSGGSARTAVVGALNGPPPRT